MTPEELTRNVLARLPARRLSRGVRYGGWGALVVAGSVLALLQPVVLLGLAALVATVLINALGE